jgi:hypothetical protein
MKKLKWVFGVSVAIVLAILAMIIAEGSGWVLPLEETQRELLAQILFLAMLIASFSGLMILFTPPSSN